MKLSLAVALHLSLLAAAAPTSLNLKRDNGASPSAGLTDIIGGNSLKSAAEMLNLYSTENDETKANDSGVSSNMPVNTTPNSMANVPSADGTQDSIRPRPSEDAEAATSPVTGDEEEEEEGEEEEAAVTGGEEEEEEAATGEEEEEEAAVTGDEEEEEEEAVTGDEDEEEEEEEETSAASPSSDASEPAAQQNMLGGLPVLGSLTSMLGM
ncbi:uncharacterized protein DSM5745_11032 [Aspergillus mulundensis]|uniref:Uncharacterized protein n=1 Tax=Aspergillus mulundensis TaxID=1810919 RepID=A0A3D8QCA1_9EURO|nr:hypothetical protein DSM5745_11032 [Aspergillus mulundensis]RDW59337.1 hypothetical protein DSM5745_11032 [Aspergillus mulundensis]